MMENPYEKCPAFETAHFLLRLVRLEDTEDLLKCYSDPKAQALFNADHCTSDFCYKTADELSACIELWLKAYEKHEFIRWAIVDKALGKAVGTIEMFGRVGVYQSPLGVLRLDICSEYEHTEFLDELMTLCVQEFFPLFDVDQILHKAVPAAVDRIQVLKKLGFQPQELPDRPHAWVLQKGVAMKNQLERIAASYDKGIEVNLYDHLPDKIINHPDYKLFKEITESAGPKTGGDSGFADIRTYLAPAAGMKFIDLGCSANLIINGYDAWPSLYHGVDISRKTIELLKKFTEKRALTVGVLVCGSIHETPFEDSCFDIGACIGVLEYYKKDFVEMALKEMHRIMKPGGKLAVDIPNITSPACRGMMLLEANAGRPDLFDLLPLDFESLVGRYFEIDKVAKADEWPMFKYFLKSKN